MKRLRWDRISTLTSRTELIEILNRRLAGLRDGDPALLLVHLDGGGFEMTTGIKLDIPFPDFGATIKGWELVADQSGSLVIDLWKDSYGNYPPTGADTITASAKPTLSSAAKNRAVEVPTWNRIIRQGETIRVNIDSVSGITRATLGLSLVKA